MISGAAWGLTGPLTFYLVAIFSSLSELGLIRIIISSIAPYMLLVQSQLVYIPFNNKEINSFENNKVVLNFIFKHFLFLIACSSIYLSLQVSKTNALLSILSFPQIIMLVLIGSIYALLAIFVCRYRYYLKAIKDNVTQRKVSLFLLIISTTILPLSVNIFGAVGFFAAGILVNSSLLFLISFF